MKPFAYERVDRVVDAVTRAAGRGGAMYVAGGTNLVDHLKLGVASPELLVDVSRIPMDVVEALDDGGLQIGANVRNADLAANALVRRDYPVLSQAVLAGASGQIRNVATTAGNLLQRTRCRYFQDVSTPCNKREPGSGCPAVEGFHRNLAILGASEHCVATHPSDLAVALAALDATVVTLDLDGGRRIPIEELYRAPGSDPSRDTVLAPGELVTAVELPALPLARRSAYRKVRDRASYAFALVSVAAAVDVHDGVIRDVRIALGGVAHRPWRATLAEDALRGLEPTDGAFRAAAEVELARAEPLRDNGFKVPMARNTIAAVLRDLTGVAR
jgi:xanthine dehydrogenase YagS FAD-binding subunit